MNCTACQRESPPHAKFCLECGAALASRCARCATELPPVAKFCLECGAQVGGTVPTQPAAPAAPERSPRSYTPKHLADRILASRAALEGERKQVTVLFADVKGSMELAEAVGAEEWHALLDRFFAILADGVHRFEGTVNQYTGDGIMALFGAPLAHEDHAQRACYAALALRDALREFAREAKRRYGVDFATRIGLHSGDVVVGRIGDDLRMDYTAQGHTVGLAQRMEALASGGDIYASAATAALAQGYFAFDDLGEFAVRGVAQPVRVFELSGVGALRTRFDVSRARGLSRFVGRASELATLEDALERAIAGQGGVVGIVAEAGTGKSRLCFELAERARARGVGVRQTQAYAHTQNIPLVPVLELYRQIFGIAAGDAPQSAREKIAGRIVLLDEEAREALPLLFDFLGVADPERPAPAQEPELRERRLLDLLRRLTTARGRREPALVVFEDLHWADPASVRFAATLCEAAEASRTLVVLNYRPEFRAPWAGRSFAQQIALRPLDAAATAELLASWLGADASLGPAIAAIQARAAGNPFFVEELVLSLVESGALAGERGRYRLVRTDAEALALPERVQALLAARIDRLGEREKELLATAAVIGQVFTERLLARASGAAPEALRESLARLVERELVVERALYPEAEYAFRHPLVVEVAYQAQLANRRARIHGAVARALVEAAGERADAQAPLVAQHFDAAGEAEPALRWHARAARQLVNQNAASAVAHARRVLALEPTLPPNAEIASASREARLLLSLALGRGGEEREGERDDVLREALAAAERSDDFGTLAILLANDGLVRWARGRRDWEQPLERAAGFAERLGSRMHAALVAHLHSVVLANAGRLVRARSFAERALELLADEPPDAPLLAGYDVRVRSMNVSANLDHSAGRIAEAVARRERALALGNRGDAMGYAFALAGRVSSGLLIGGGAAWLADARAAFELLQQSGATVSSQFLAEQLLALGHAEEARELALAARAAARAAEQVAVRLANSRIAAEACAALGDFARAREAADEAVALARELTTPAPALLARARVGLAMRDARAADAIEADLALAVEAARAEGAGLWEAHALEASAELAALRGDAAARERALQDALAIWERGGATACAERVRRALAEA